MKFNWGIGIAIFIVIFLLTVFVRIFISYQQKINLVTPEYYPKEMQHEQHLEKIRNYKDLVKKVEISDSDKGVVFAFPAFMGKNDVSGQILFYRPSDFEMDVKTSISLNDENQQIIETDNLIRGQYILQLDFEFGGKQFYFEEKFFKK